MKKQNNIFASTSIAFIIYTGNTFGWTGCQTSVNAAEENTHQIRLAKNVDLLKSIFIRRLLPAI